jgi:hypothetical protein
LEADRSLADLADEIESARIPELLGEIERLPATLERGYAAGGGPSITTKGLSNTAGVSRCTVLGCTAKRLIAEHALLLVPDPIGLQHLLPALRTSRDEGHAR